MTKRRAGLGLALLCILAVAIRAWHIRWGLPEVYEEAGPLHIARGFWGNAPEQVGLRPNSYGIPSLAPMLLFFEQAVRYFGLSLAGRVDSLNDFRQLLDQEWGRAVLHARWLNALLSGLLVLPVFALGRRVGGAAVGWLAACLVVVAPPSVIAGRMVTPDALLLVLSATALVQATAMVQEGSRRAYLWCALCSACALTTSYAGGWLMVAYLTAHGVGSRRRGVSPIGILAHLPFWEGLVVFGLTAAVTMPYAVLDPAGVWAGIQEARTQLTLEHLGAEGATFAGLLWDWLQRGWGVIPAVAGVGGLAWCLVRSRSRNAVLPGAVAFVFGLVLLGAWGAEHVHALILFTPLVAVWAAVLPVALGSRFASPTPARGVALALAGLVIAAPAARSWDALQASGREDSRQASGRWLEEVVTPRTAIVTESYGPNLNEHLNVLVLPFNAVSPHVFDAAYTPELVSGVDYVVLSSKIYDRYRREPDTYPQQNRFYQHLPLGFELERTFEPPDYVGPEIRIFKRREDSKLKGPQSIPRRAFDSLKGNSPMAEFLSQLGVVLARNGQEEDALHLLKEAVVMDPKGVGPWTNLGTVQLEANRVDDALFSLRKARDLNPENARVHYNLGILNQKNAEWSQAETEFAKALDLDPSMEQAFLSLARVLVQGEHYARARVVLREFIFRFPRSPHLAQAQEALDALRSMGSGKP